MKSKFVMVDIESDGPCPGLYSMISFGAVIVETPDPKFGFRTFLGKLKPISDKFIPEALAVSGFTREQTLEFHDPKFIMQEFDQWLMSCNCYKPMFISDNNGFDWQFMNYYFHHFLGSNPFGYSSTNLGSLYKGMIKSMFKNFKHLRVTKHSHDPVDDAIGNVEALLKISSQIEGII